MAEELASGTPFGQQVARERKRRKWTQRTLEEKSGLDHIRIHRIETDPERPISFEDVMRLAAAFGVPASWLVRGGEMRSRILAAARTASDADAEDAVDRVVHILELADQLAAVSPEHASPPPTLKEIPRGTTPPRTWGRQAADAFRTLTGTPSGPLDDLPSFIESHTQIYVAIDQFPQSVDGLALRDPETGLALIAANSGLSWERQRFTLAHELGHLLAGELAIEAVTAGGTGPRSEQAAHEFARNVLVPIHDLQDRSQQLGVPWTAAEAAAIAWEYRVSPAVIGIQLERAGLGTVTLTRQLSGATAETWSHLGGWAPSRDSLAASAKSRRIPPTLAASARRAWQDRRIPTATLGRLLGLDTDEVEALLRQVGVKQVKIQAIE